LPVRASEKPRRRSRWGPRKGGTYDAPNWGAKKKAPGHHLLVRRTHSARSLEEPSKARAWRRPDARAKSRKTSHQQRQHVREPRLRRSINRKDPWMEWTLRVKRETNRSEVNASGGGKCMSKDGAGGSPRQTQLPGGCNYSTLRPQTRAGNEIEKELSISSRRDPQIRRKKVRGALFGLRDGSFGGGGGGWGGGFRLGSGFLQTMAAFGLLCLAWEVGSWQRHRVAKPGCKRKRKGPRL